jgi:photosynthetic reaction center H subunit
MNTGAVTGYFDVAQIVLYAFWIFFAGLIIYLRREDKREGYPLESDRSGGRVNVQGFPAMPPAKSFHLADGSVVKAPRIESATRPIMANPMGAVGPAAYAQRANIPDHTIDGQPMIVPLRAAPGFAVASSDPDPRGMAVLGADRELGGVVRELWVDRAEPQIRYLEVDTGVRSVLLPITFAKIDASRRQVNVRSILSAQFATVPSLSNPDQVTRREEDQITAYYAGGNLYATASRSEPLL